MGEQQPATSRISTSLPVTWPTPHVIGRHRSRDRDATTERLRRSAHCLLRLRCHMRAVPRRASPRPLRMRSLNHANCAFIITRCLFYAFTLAGRSCEKTPVIFIRQFNCSAAIRSCPIQNLSDRGPPSEWRHPTPGELASGEAGAGPWELAVM